MTTEVTISRADLLTLLQGVVGLKTIESTLRGLAGEPPTPGEMTRVIDRLTKAYNVSGRETRDYPPNGNQLRTLNEMFGPEDAGALNIQVPTDFTLKHRDLIKDGFVELGVYRETWIWNTSGEIRSKDAPHFLCRLTPRGRHWLYRPDTDYTDASPDP